MSASTEKLREPRRPRIPGFHLALISTLTLLAACAAPPSPTGAQWRIDRRITIEDPPTAEAGPSALLRLDDELFVTLSHLRAYKPAGPGWLSIHDATSLERMQLVTLEHDGRACLNPVSVTRDDDRLLIACAGEISFDEPSQDGALAVVDLAERRVTALVPVGHSPGSVARSGDHLWLSEGEKGGLWHLDANTLEPTSGLVTPCRLDESHHGYVSDVALFDGRVFAACFNDDTVVELDPATGARLGDPLPTGDAPNRLAVLGDALFSLDNLGGTLSSLVPESRPSWATLGGDGGGNDPQGIAGDASIAGITNSAWGTFVVLDLTQSPPVLVDSVDLKAGAGAPSSFPTAVSYADGVFHVVVPGLELDTNDVPGELVRLVRVE